jgi:hypothetical protein
LIAGATAALTALAWLLAGEGGTVVAPPQPTLGSAAAAASTSAAAAAPNAGVPGLEGDVTGPNRICLDGLREHQVAFVELPTKGVRTPVRILGAIGAVRLRSHDRRATGLATPLMDCELARALLDAAPAFRALGIRELLFSGTYQYRMRRHSNKLSEHAHGLAVDVHTFALDVEAGHEASDEGLVDVARDFESQVGTWNASALADQEGCIGHPQTSKGRLLRTLACRLRASSVFREVITPDDNADHSNHFHLEAFPDALTRTRAVLAHKPSVTDD